MFFIFGFGKMKNLTFWDERLTSTSRVRVRWKKKGVEHHVFRARNKTQEAFPKHLTQQPFSEKIKTSNSSETSRKKSQQRSATVVTRIGRSKTESTAKTVGTQRVAAMVARSALQLILNRR